MLQVDIYTPYMRILRARANADIRTYAIFMTGLSVHVFMLYFFSISYIPFAVSCVTVPSDLDLIFSRLSCAVRFDLHE